MQNICPCKNVRIPVQVVEIVAENSIGAEASHSPTTLDESPLKSVGMRTEK